MAEEKTVKAAAEKATAAKKEPAVKRAAKKADTVTITLKKSLIACKQKQIATAGALGLKRPGDVTVQPDNDSTKGKIAVIAHLVEVQ